MTTNHHEKHTIVVITGPPCTGKSTLAEACAAALSAPVLGWDWAMAGIAVCEPVQQEVDALDRPAQRRLGWAILTSLAEAQLRNGRSVVLDGVARGEHIEMVRDVASRNGARSIVVLTSCSNRARLRDRVQDRSREIPGWYELDWDHVGSYVWDPPTDVDYTVDTSLNPNTNRLAQCLLG